MSKKTKLAHNATYNRMLIVIGILSFMFFYFAIGAGYLSSFTIASLPIIVGIANLKEIRNKNKS